MGNIVFTERTKKDGFFLIAVSLVPLLAGVVYPMVRDNTNPSPANPDTLRFSMVYCAVLFLILFVDGLDSIRYQLIVTTEAIQIISLLRNQCINFSNVENYVIKDSNRKGYKIIAIRAKNKVLSVRTQHSEELIELLNAHGAERIVKTK